MPGETQETDVVLSVIIPVYNESQIIDATLTKVAAYLDSINESWEVILVDDGSTDDSAFRIQKFAERKAGFRLVSNKVNQGKGFSIKRGALEASGKYVLFSDADLSTPIEEAKKLLTCLGNGYDVAIGARGIAGKGIYVPQPLPRKLAGKAFSFIANVIVPIKLADTQCGFKAYRAEAAKNIFRRQKIRGFAFDIENLFLARKLGYSIKEVPVDWINNPDSRVNLLKDSLKMLRDLLAIRFYSWNGCYE